jgi:hypothetical protein
VSGERVVEMGTLLLMVVVGSLLAFYGFLGSGKRMNPVFSEKATVLLRRQRGRWEGKKIVIEYFATFLLENGEELKFTITHSAYRNLVDGMRGVLTYQGDRFKKFE